MMDQRVRNYNALIPLSFKRIENKPRIFSQNESYDLQDISFLLKIPLKKLKKEYMIGMILLEALVRLFHILEEHNDEDMVEYSRANSLKNQWDIDKKFLTYLKFIDFHIYALMDKYDKELISMLKYKSKVS